MERTGDVTPKVHYAPPQPGVAGPVPTGPSRAVHLRVTLVQGSSDPNGSSGNKGIGRSNRGRAGTYGWTTITVKQIDKRIVDHPKLANQ